MTTRPVPRLPSAGIKYKSRWPTFQHGFGDFNSGLWACKATEPLLKPLRAAGFKRLCVRLPLCRAELEINMKYTSPARERHLAWGTENTGVGGLIQNVRAAVRP